MENRIEIIRRSKRMSMETLAEMVGTTASTINKLEKNQMRLSDRWIGPIAKALNVDEAELFREASQAQQQQAAIAAAPDLPVYGLAAGSILGSHAITNEPIQYVSCPSGLAKVRDAYALMVTGTSMEPRYFAGDIIFLHPHKPIRPDDHIVIQEERDGGTITSIKLFKKQTDDQLIAWQYNPASEVKFNRKYISAVHRVMTSNELLGL